MWDDGHICDGVVIEPEPHAAGERALDLWLTPHGFLKAALAHRARVRSAPDGGTRVTFTVLDTYEVTGLIGPTHLVERIETAIPHPVLGDMPSVTVFHGYRDVGGVQFPSRIEQTRGGHPVLDVTVGAVVPNPPLAILPPREVVGAVAPPVRVELDEVDEGVHYVTGGSHHSVVIEFGDHVAIVEAPLDDARSRAVIDAVRGLLPRKAIRYVINTHHHFDHAGGLRAYVAEGAIVVTHAINRAFYERAWSAPRTILPDRLAAAPRPPEFITVDDWHELTDRRRFIEVYHVAGNTHDEGLLMVWMPRERILIQADAFTPAPPGAEPPGPNPFSVNLYENIERLGLPVDLILPLHGEMATAEDLRQAAGRGDTAVEAGSGVVNRRR
jgi:glyoxylase-like metal-dependent hydrolase (beta-lactamase superfamily II)